MDGGYLGLTLSTPWAAHAVDIVVEVSATGLRVCSATSEGSSDSSHGSARETRVLAGPGDYELLVPRQGLQVFRHRAC